MRHGLAVMTVLALTPACSGSSAWVDDHALAERVIELCSTHAEDAEAVRAGRADECLEAARHLPAAYDAEDDLMRTAAEIVTAVRVWRDTGTD
jgi:hypothetical protein